MTFSLSISFIELAIDDNPANMKPNSKVQSSPRNAPIPNPPKRDPIDFFGALFFPLTITFLGFKNDQTIASMICDKINETINHTIQNAILKIVITTP